MDHFEHQLKNFLEVAPVAICIFRGPDYVIEFANERMLALWSKNIEEVINVPVFKGLPEAAGQGFEQLLDKVFTTGERFVTEETPLTLLRNGRLEQTYIKLVCEALREQEGNITGIMAVATEITQQVQARKNAEDSEIRFANILLNSPMATAILKGPDMIVEIINPVLIDIWGKGNDVRGKPLFEVLPEIKSQGFEAILKKVYEGEPFYGYEMEVFVDIKGVLKAKYFNFVYQPFTEVDGTISGVTILATEVTDAVKAKKMVEKADAKLRNLVKNAPVAMCVLNGPEYIIEMANDQYLEMVGKTAEQLMAKPLIEALPEIKEQGILELLNAVYETGEPFVANEMPVTLIRHGKPELMYFNFVYEPLYASDDTITGILAVVNDVTQQVIAVKTIEESEKGLNMLANAMPQLVWIAEPSGEVAYFNNRIGEFDGAVKHDNGHWLWAAMVHGDDLAPTEDCWSKAVEKGTFYQMEHRLKRLDGNYRWYLSRGFPQKNKKEK